MVTDWSLEAAGNWDSVAGENCNKLADLAQKGLDAVSAGYEVTIPSSLRNVERSSYRRRSAPAVATAAGNTAAGEDVFTVWVGPLEPTVKAETLEAALKTAYGLESVCEAWVPATVDYGFVGFKSQQEQLKVLGKTFMLHGKIARIQEDTRQQKRTTGVMDAIWAAYSRFARVSLAALDNDQLFIPPDPEVEADVVTSDPAAHAAVEKELQNVCWQMAKAYRESSTGDGSFHNRMDQIKHEVKLKLTCKHGLQRDLWASAWYTQMRLRLNRDLKQWARSETGRQAGVERPYPKLWINEIFGTDWDYMKAKRLPPQRSKRSMEKGIKTRQRHRGKA